MVGVAVARGGEANGVVGVLGAWVGGTLETAGDVGGATVVGWAGVPVGDAAGATDILQGDHQ